MFQLEPGEEMIRKTKPHSASFLSSIAFWAGVLILFLGVARGFVAIFDFTVVLLVGAGFLLIGLGYIRGVSAYTFYLTDRRVVSNYSFLRKARREIYYDKMIDAMVVQGIFGKTCGYADVWLYGYQSGWIVGRMRGVRLGDSHIIVNKAWKNKA
jgi:hypothetical protein